MSAVSNTSTSTLNSSNGLDAIAPANNANGYWSNSTNFINNISTESSAISAQAIHAKHSDETNTNADADNQLINSPNRDKSIYRKPLEQENSLEKSPIRQENSVATTTQKQQEENDRNPLSKVLSYVKNLFSEKSTNNDDTLKINQALAVLINDVANNEKASHALDYLAKQAASRKAFFSFSSKEERIDNFSVNLIKDITTTNSLLKLIKRALHFTDLSTPGNTNKTDRALFIDSLIKNIENRINQHLSSYIRANYKSTSIIRNPEQTQKTYAEMLSYIKAIKSEMRPVTQQLTDEEKDKESIAFLANTLGNICASNNFSAKAMPETQLLPEPIRLKFIQSIHGKIDKKIQSLHFDQIFNPDNSTSDYKNAIKVLEETKANIRQ